MSMVGATIVHTGWKTSRKSYRGNVATLRPRVAGYGKDIWTRVRGAIYWSISNSVIAWKSDLEPEHRVIRIKIFLKQFA